MTFYEITHINECTQSSHNECIPHLIEDLAIQMSHMHKINIQIIGQCIFAGTFFGCYHLADQDGIGIHLSDQIVLQAYEIENKNGP